MAVKMCSVFMLPFYKHLQNKACKYADKVIAVSNGYIRRICGNKYKAKSYMIPNGYDISDAMADAKRQKNDKLTLVYVGALYEGKRDITPIFRALYELSANKDIDIAKIKFAYAGENFATLFSQAERYKMQEILENYGKLTRNDCLKMQYASDLLVLSTWNERGEEGVFPGKFLEYMLIGRPILSVTSGNISHGEVTSVMREGQFGIAYESACDKEDFGQLKNYIKNCYSEWLQKGTITFEPVKEVLERYNYNNIIKQIEELMCE
ncbi:MAG: glycosyltransferase [Christensenellaceae bacterium]